MRLLFAALGALVLFAADTSAAEQGRCVYRTTTDMRVLSGRPAIVLSLDLASAESHVAWRPGSNRPAKQIVELQLMECAFKDWVHTQYKALVK